ncbi:trehalose-6-phosphate synthase [Natrialbaceae archaeon GCM10025810]|uniref:alpha,alpha-trehalose-phosphate synthase (UDP-forming) n=1 Tax=Halovalidus salilacus TaxID=3075124 RepID=UPI0036238E15
MRVPDQRVIATDGSGDGFRRGTAPPHRTDDRSRAETFCPDSLIVVSNRQPYRHEYDSGGGSTDSSGDGSGTTPASGSSGERSAASGSAESVALFEEAVEEFTVDEPTGGLTAGLDPVMRRASGTWVAWGDGDADRAVTDDRGCVAVPPGEEAYTLRRVWLSDEDVDSYYYGFSNRVLWPLCHGFTDLVEIRPNDFERYYDVNRQFADAVADHATADSVVWLQDYHLGFASALIRDRVPGATIAQFWHVPWPTPETFAHFPRGRDLLEGLLGNDLLGFHTKRYADAFLRSVDRFVPDAAVDWNRGVVRYDGRETAVNFEPMGVDAAAFDRRARETDGEWEEFREAHDVPRGCVIGLGVDRLDYTKGIPERLAAVERFFERNPGWREEFTFVQKATPSRTEIPTYERYGELVRSEVARINARFATDGWRPIVYTEDVLPQSQLGALYRRADVMIVSPLLDGMNLVAQEYVASSVDGDGALLLSDRAGAHETLGSHAYSIDPPSTDQVAAALERALSTPLAERRRRMNVLRQRVFADDLDAWMETQFRWLRRCHESSADGNRGAGDRSSDGVPADEPR